MLQQVRVPLQMALHEGRADTWAQGLEEACALPGVLGDTEIGWAMGLLVSLFRVHICFSL